MLTREEYRALKTQPEAWRPRIAAVCARHGLPREDIQPLGGSNLVARLGCAWIVKLFPPFLRYQYEAERLALADIEGQAPLATPRIVEDGELEDWPYLVLTFLPGISLEEVWPNAGEPERLDLLSQIGGLVSAVQRIAPGRLADHGPPWEARLASLIEGCEVRHTRLGLPAPLLAELGPWLARARARGAFPDGARGVILTGEYTPGNLLVEREAGRWLLTGLVDFGDAMIGPAEYDLLGPLTFLGAGRADRVAAFLGGAGWTLGPELRERLMALLLCHRHSDLDVQVAAPGWRDAGSLDALAELVFPISAQRPGPMIG